MLARLGPLPSLARQRRRRRRRIEAPSRPARWQTNKQIKDNYPLPYLAARPRQACSRRAVRSCFVAPRRAYLHLAASERANERARSSPACFA